MNELSFKSLKEFKSLKSKPNICIQCKQFVKFYCSCNHSPRFCCECYLSVHKNNHGDHYPKNLEKISKEITEKTHSDEETKLESFKFSRNLIEIQKQLQTNFKLILQHSFLSFFSKISYSNCIICRTRNNVFVVACDCYTVYSV